MIVALMFVILGIEKIPIDPHINGNYEDENNSTNTKTPNRDISISDPEIFIPIIVASILLIIILVIIIICLSKHCSSCVPCLLC